VKRQRVEDLAVLHSSCCGIDVHQKSISACVLTVDGAGKLTSEVRQFGTTTHELRALNDWLAQCAVTYVAMESTGIYWKPIFNLLEGQVEVVLANAAHLKNVPGRKTDTADCAWIATLLRHGLIKASFVPPQPIRELRDLTGSRTTLMRERGAINAKSLDDAGTFVGLASTYGGPPDLVGDVVEPGAFRQAIQSQGKGFPLLWAHMQSEPLGLAKISDSPQGLTVNGSLLMRDPAAQRAYEHLKMGSIKGLSIGYRVDPANTTYSDDGATRTLRSIRLFEISLCAVPCNPGALVQSVKSLAQVETVLRSYRPGAVSDADLDQLRNIDAMLKGLLRKDQPAPVPAIPAWLAIAPSVTTCAPSAMRAKAVWRREPIMRRLPPL
jgi:HK97 family phage prohead protease